MSATKAVVPLPERVSQQLQTHNATTLEGAINILPFQATLKPNSKGAYYLKLPQAVCIATRISVGDQVTVEITRIGEEKETRMPADLRKTLVAAPKAKALWEDITPIARRDWIFWMISAKQAETRKRRINSACNMLASGKRRVCCFAGIRWLIIP